jgi:capsular polysaccharide export protein
MPFDTTYYGDSVFRQALGYASEYLWRKVNDEQLSVEEIVSHRRQGKRLFAAILQKPGDAQLRVHSSYGSNNPFLREVCLSFAVSAPKDAILIVKQHPLDYGVERTPRFFASLVKDLKLEGRAYYLRKTSIDIVLDNVDGFVTINSTAGLAAVQRGLLVKCCGKAIFDMEGLTFQGNLDSFWTESSPPHTATVNAFIAYLTRYSQINGALYAPKGMVLASKAVCDIISYDLFSPHHMGAADKAEGWDKAIPLSLPALNAA